MPLHIKLLLTFLSLSLAPIIILFFMVPQLSGVFIIPNNAPILIILFVTVIAITLISLFTAIQLSLPLRELREIARKVQNGDLSQRANIKTNDEIGELASAFNIMLDDLQNKQVNLQQENYQVTEDIKNKIQDLEDTKNATLNLLEDLEEVKNREESLVKDLEKFKLALDNSTDTVIITDPEGIVIYANKSVEKITGYRSEEAIGKKSGVLWKMPMSAEYYHKLWDTIKTQKKTFTSEIQNRRKSGEVYTSTISISPILDEKGGVEFFVSVEHDISREKEIDRAKTEFVSLASHQLRTPLSTINWYLEMLLSENKTKLSDDQKEYVEEAALASKRMVGLVNSLLNVSRIEMGTFSVEPELIDIAEVIKSVISELEHKILENKFAVISVYDPSVPKVWVDPKLTEIICQNILENAINYTPAGGKIRVSLKREGSDILIIVEDNGIGIPKSQQPAIFTKLFRADNARERKPDGNGLGLYMVKSIVEHSGGKIWFESPKSKGTTFYVTIPVSGMKAKTGTKSLT